MVLSARRWVVGLALAARSADEDSQDQQVSKRAWAMSACSDLHRDVSRRSSVDPPPVGRHTATHFLTEGETRFAPLPPHLARGPDTTATQSARVRAETPPHPASHGRSRVQDLRFACTSILPAEPEEPGTIKSLYAHKSGETRGLS